jgi:hypothetical protein
MAAHHGGSKQVPAQQRQFVLGHRITSERLERLGAFAPGAGGNRAFGLALAYVTSGGFHGYKEEDSERPV